MPISLGQTWFVSREAYLVSKPDGSRFTKDASRSLHLFHPVGLTDLLKFNIERDPRAFHFGVDFAEPTFPNSSAGPVCHELRTLGLERIVRNRRAFMDSTHMRAGIIFTWDKNANRHGSQCKRIEMDRQSLALMCVKKDR